MKTTFTLAALGMLLFACGPTEAPAVLGARCSPSTCGGCCDSLGVCQPGLSTGACGKNGATCVACSGNQACEASMCTTKMATGLPAGGKLVFTTSGEYSGDLGGAEGADAKCIAAAQAAGLKGVFVAWISHGQDAYDRVTSAGPFYLTCPANGAYVKAFNSRAQLQGAASVRIDCNEFGERITTDNSTTALVWTGTNSGGLRSTERCDWSRSYPDWTHANNYFDGTAGAFGPNASTTEWTRWSDVNCANTAHLYCFQN